MDRLKVFRLPRRRRDADFLFAKQRIYGAGFAYIGISDQADNEFFGSSLGITGY